MINETALLAASPLASVLNMLQALVGGLFGLYIVMLVLRWWECKKLVKLLKSIQEEVSKLNKNIAHLKK